MKAWLKIYILFQREIAPDYVKHWGKLQTLDHFNVGLVVLKMAHNLIWTPSLYQSWGFEFSVKFSPLLTKCSKFKAEFITIE